jgi:hypothetical protein
VSVYNYRVKALDDGKERLLADFVSPFDAQDFAQTMRERGFAQVDVLNLVSGEVL